VTIIAAVLISAFNALTLSPALCAAAPRSAPRSHGPDQPGDRRGARRTAQGTLKAGAFLGLYALVVGKRVRFSVLGVVLVVAFGLGVGGLARVTPTSFLPEEDQGARKQRQTNSTRRARRRHLCVLKPPPSALTANNLAIANATKPKH
jgi:multidrug efflux pump subunit AcrB